MIAQLISLMCLFGIVLLGVLVMLQVVKLQDVLGALGRLVAAGVVLAFALCLGKAFVAVVLIPWFLRLRDLLIYPALALFVLAIVLLVVRFRATKSVRRSRSHGGDL